MKPKQEHISKVLVVNKKVGQTPLEALEETRIEQGIDVHVPMTYAGRLDPMAEGLLLILIGDECKQKEKYLGLDKVYEIEVLFGVSTDTGDILGMITASKQTTPEVVSQISKIDVSKYVGKFEQTYPHFSSKKVAGKQLHTHAREETLPAEDEMPKKSVEIYSIVHMGVREETLQKIVDDTISRISLVTGDFRQKNIIDEWKKMLTVGLLTNKIAILKLRVACSSGTYMRTLAEKIGSDLGIPSLAYSIKRKKIGSYAQLDM